jgi:hypothetical protein
MKITTKLYAVCLLYKLFTIHGVRMNEKSHSFVISPLMVKNYFQNVYVTKELFKRCQTTSPCKLTRKYCV